MRSVVCLLIVAACGDQDQHSPPDTAFDAVPAAVSNVQPSLFSFHTIGPANAYRCVVDGGEPTECLPPVELTLPDGEHTFSVSAAFTPTIDLTPATYTWRMDTVPPGVELLAVPAERVASHAARFAFTGGTGTTAFECTLDGATATCSSPHDVTVADGAHAFAVTALDEAGNRAAPRTHAWTVDTALADTAITAGPDEAGASAPAVTFEFASPDPTATFECSLDDAGFAACASPVELALAAGPHTFAVRAVRFGGVDPTPATRGWTVIDP
jgi:large repetitive protein